MLHWEGSRRSHAPASLEYRRGPGGPMGLVSDILTVVPWSLALCVCIAVGWGGGEDTHKYFAFRPPELRDGGEKKPCCKHI